MNAGKKIIIYSVLYKQITGYYKEIQLLREQIYALESLTDEVNYDSNMVKNLEKLYVFIKKLDTFANDIDNEFTRYFKSVISKHLSTLNKLFISYRITDIKEHALNVIEIFGIVFEVNNLICSYLFLVTKNALDYDYKTIVVDVNLIIDDKTLFRAIEFKQQSILPHDLKFTNIIFCFKTSILGIQIKSCYVLTIDEQLDKDRLDKSWNMGRYEFLTKLKLSLEYILLITSGLKERNILKLRNVVLTLMPTLIDEMLALELETSMSIKGVIYEI